MRLAGLALGLLLTSPAAPPPRDTVGTRLVIVTFERRASPHFRSRPDDYGRFLAEQREEVLSLLFGEAPLARPGDYVALLADGAPPGFASSTGLHEGSTPPEVIRSLGRMLTLPGSGEPLWFAGVSDTLGRAAVDGALRTLITCPLAGARGACDERVALGSWGTLGFSRPLLTFPVQYRLAAGELRRRTGEAPDEVYWVWVQVGHRTNEITALAEEIRRDFHPREAASAVMAFRDSTLRALAFRFVPAAGLAPDSLAGGGPTLWEVSSAGLYTLFPSEGDSAFLFQDAARGEPLPRLRREATSIHRAAPSLLESAGLRLVLRRAAAAGGARFLRVRGEAVCVRGSGEGPPPLREPLDWSADPGGRTATLSPASGRALARLARRCLPSQGFLARLQRELAGGDGAGVRLHLTVRAQVAPPPREDGIEAPPRLVTSTLERSWRHVHLRWGEWVLHGLAALAFLGVAVGLGLWARFRRSSTQLDLELRTPDGEPVTAETPITLSPGSAAALPELDVVVVHRGGRLRPWVHAVEVSGSSLQAEIPIVPGGDATRLVVLRPRGDADSNGGASVRFEGTGAAGEVPAGRMALRVRDDVLDLDRTPVGVSLRAGVEVRAKLTSRTARVVGRTRTFYVPCVLEVGRAPAAEPHLRIEPLQVYLYRGLRPDSAPSGERGTRLGVLRIMHRADPRTGARPYPVRLCLEVEARILDGAGAAVGRARVALESREVPVRRALEVVVDAPDREVPIYLWPDDAALLAGEAGSVEVSVAGTWEEMHEDRPVVPRPLGTALERVAWYPVETLYGVAVDFGTSATRLAFLREGMPADRTMGIGVPAELVPEAVLGGAGGEVGDEQVPLTGELSSGVAVDGAGKLRAAGPSALVRGRGWDVFPSLKEALMDPRAGRKAWSAAEEVIGRLGAWVARKEGGGAILDLCRWRDRRWQFQHYQVPPPFAYLLLVTIPDTFDREKLAEFVHYFRRWTGWVKILPLREAEAVVFGALMRDPEHRPARTLVVDVGAGTVDYAAVRSTFDERGVLVELRVEGLGVSRAAGNAYDEALARHLGQEKLPPRTWRETKERGYIDPEAGGTLTPAAEAFLASPELERHLAAAVSVPLQAVLGRLARHDAWKGVGFDRVILSGRGSMALGWKRYLVKELLRLRLVPGASGGEAWLSWLEPGPPDHRADRLKAAVAEGALALISHNQARIQTSRDILRDHLVLVAQSSAGRYCSELVMAAGEVLPAGGIARRVAVGDWVDAKLVLSSHPPTGGGGVDGAAEAHVLWSRGVDGAIDDGAGAVPVVRLGADIPIVGRPAEATHGLVRVEEGGGVSFAWEPS